MCKCNCCAKYGPLPEWPRPSLMDAYIEYLKTASDEDKKRVYRTPEDWKHG